ncbi:MAG: hypothetical protein M5U19_07470 [Microthrixaceae bacterium]|nr:hypothetical protein [Microthrixaceae bacterium]
MTADSFLVTRDDARAALSGEPGVVLASELESEGVKVGDRYRLGGSDVELPVLGFTFAGTYGHAPIAFVSLETWQRIQYGGQPDGRFSAVALRGDAKAIEQAGSGRDSTSSPSPRPTRGRRDTPLRPRR